MLQTLNQYDHELMLWLNYDGGSYLDAFWFGVTTISTWIPMYLIMIAVIGYESYRIRNWKPFFAFILATALIILAADQITSGLIKPWAQRPRPSHQEGVMEYLHYVNDYRGGAYGFCSSHAANSFALAVWISLLFRKPHIWCAMISYALLNCYSRIYVGVHYPGDILVGSIIGILCGWLGYYAYAKVSNKLGFPLLGQSNSFIITGTFWLTILVLLIVAAF